MKIRMQSGRSKEELVYGRWDLALQGNAVDDRGEAATAFTAAQADRIIALQYHPSTFELQIDDRRVNSENIAEAFEGFAKARIVFETSTLGFPELILCCRALRELGVTRLTLVYVEPGSYTAGRKTQVLHRRDFELSEEMGGFLAIPGSAFILDDNRPKKVVFFLGYEGQRLDQALEQFGIKPSNCSVAFGVPAFQPGWEMDAFANNIRVIKERQISGGVLFCGAENPAGAVHVLESAYRAQAQGERFFISPIGTKPHGIGAALFACEHDDVGVLYDHPKRKAKRSSGVGTWHLFEVEFG